jgi:hypothetical protein
MKKRIILSACLLCSLLASCGGNGTQDDSGLVNLLKSKGTSTDEGYEIEEQDTSTGHLIVRQLHYNSKTNKYVGINEVTHFMVDSSTRGHTISEESWSFGKYFKTAKISIQSIVINGQIISYTYSNVKFDSDGEVKEYDYKVNYDQYGATSSQIENFASALVDYDVDCLRWAQRQFQSVGGTFI